MKLPAQANGCFCTGVNFPNLARLAMLSTYIRRTRKPRHPYDTCENDGLLVIGNARAQRPMRKKDMREVLQFSQRMFSKFFTDLASNGLLLQQEDGTFAVNNEFFFRGKIVTTQSGRWSRTYVPTAKLHTDRYRRLFSSNLKNLKEIGLILRLAPFINSYHNVLCRNPYEQDAGALKRLPMTDVCRLVGMDASNAARYGRQLEGKFADITYEYNGATYHLCTTRTYSNGQKLIHVNSSVISFLPYT